MAKSPIVLWGRRGGGSSDIKMVLRCDFQYRRFEINKKKRGGKQEQNWHLVANEVRPKKKLDIFLGTARYFYKFSTYSSLFLRGDIPTRQFSEGFHAYSWTFFTV
jgi:hypothetical protein